MLWIIIGIVVALIVIGHETEGFEFGDAGITVPVALIMTLMTISIGYFNRKTFRYHTSESQ